TSVARATACGAFLVGGAFVATPPRVVDGGGAPPRRRSGSVDDSRSPGPAARSNPPRRIACVVPVRRVPRGESRNPATISPLEGSITSPQAFTTVRAPTTSGPLLRDAEPSPDFMARPIPRSLPTLAPVPAPTLPCVTGRWLAARQALRAMPAVGRARGLP